jgi:hypothetical protein
MTMHPTSPRHRVAALGLILLIGLAALTIPAAAAPPTPAAITGSVTWAPATQMITNGERVAYPWAGVDSSNKTHVLYTTNDVKPVNIRYTNNVGGSFNPVGAVIDTVAGTEKSPFGALAVGPGNVLHIVYADIGVTDDIFYRFSSNNGATWSAKQQISSGIKARSPHLAVDANNNAHIVWIDNVCGQYNVYYRSRTFASGALSAIDKPRNDCATFQNRPQITIANGVPQVVYTYGSEVEYRRFVSFGSWVGLDLSQSPGIFSGNVTIASDGGNNLVAAWDEGINNHDILFRASPDGGQTWAAALNFSNNSTLSTSPNATWSSSPKRAYITWEDIAGSSDGKPEIWMREFDPNSKDTTAALQISKAAGRSKWPVIAAGTTRADITWMDDASGTFQVHDMSGQIEGSCSGTLNLENGADMTKKNPVSGAITLTSGCQTPDQMQIAVDTPIASTTDPAPQTYSATPSIQIPAGCQHIVYVQVLKSGSALTTFQDSIKVDDSVDASVSMVNPNMAGLPTIYSQRITPADAYAGGAKDGAPGYTRVRKFFLGVSDAADCSGLKQFAAGGTGEPVTTIEAGGFAGSPALPGSASPGARTVTVWVTDTLGTGRAFSSPLIYDPADTDPSEAVSNTLGLPVLVTAQNPTVTTPASTNNLFVSLSFSNIHVNDNLYDDGQAPNDNDFWGVWVANSPTDLPSDSPLLNWIPIPVSSPGPSFAIDWGLFSGLDQATDRRAGVYFVYVRFLDGAGNPSAEVLKTQTTLQNPFTMPTLYVPLTNR